MQIADTFKALGDPMRLQMMRRLSGGTVYTVGALSDRLGLSRQGARKHLQVLVDARLVSLEKKGRETEVILDVEVLSQAQLFIAELERNWDKRLEMLKEYAESND